KESSQALNLSRSVILSSDCSCSIERGCKAAACWVCPEEVSGVSSEASGETSVKAASAEFPLEEIGTSGLAEDFFKRSSASEESDGSWLTCIPPTHHFPESGYFTSASSLFTT